MDKIQLAFLIVGSMCGIAAFVLSLFLAKRLEDYNDKNRMVHTALWEEKKSAITYVGSIARNIREEMRAKAHTHPIPGLDNDMITYETFVEKLPELGIDHKLRAHLGLKVCDSCNKLKEKCVEITVDRGKYTVMDGPYPVSPQTAQKIRDGYKHICPACLKEAKSAKSN